MVGVSLVGPCLLAVVVWILTGATTDDAGHVDAALWLGTLAVLVAVIVVARLCHQENLGLRLGCVALAVVAVAGVDSWALGGGVSDAKLAGDVATWRRGIGC
jgi:hypothetical protein